VMTAPADQVIQRQGKPDNAWQEDETMEKRRDTARYNVISLRISNQELELIRARTDKSKQSTSDFLRDALALLIGKATCSQGAGFPCREEA
jgi:hypothetical protein